MDQSSEGDGDMNETVLFNGAFVAATDARISIYDGAWLHGAGLFETMRAQNGTVFRLESYIERIRRSAERLLRPIERQHLPDAAVCRELIRRNGLTSARLRLTISAGPLRGDASSVDPSPTVCLTASQFVAYPDEYYEKGITVAVCDFRTSPSDPIAGHKTTAYLPRLLGLRDAQRVHCMEALWFTTSNHLAEGCMSNVFVIKGDSLRTPPLSTPVLPGVARGVVLEIASALGIVNEEKTLGIEDLLDADEVFLTNTIMQVMPVTRVEKRDIATARVGPITRRLMDAFCNRVRAECGG